MTISIWNEKYRPKKWENILGQNISSLRALTEKETIPHLLFTGPAGVGKTTCAVLIGKEIFKDDFTHNFMELNASDERGIDVIRKKVKEFARTQSVGNRKFKIILLDEADALTADSQNALRRIMEKYHTNCVFILTGNFKNKIIEPLQSRCMSFEFGQISKEDISKRLIQILAEEKIKYEKDALQKIINFSYPDLRKTINLLQKTAIKGSVTIKNLEISETLSISILTLILKKEFIPIRKLVVKQNPDIDQLVLDLYRGIIKSDELTVEQKKKFIIILAECAFRLSFVADKEIQFSSTIIQLIGVKNGV